MTQAAPVVVASIRPLQLLAAALTDGISTPIVVMAPGQDPHHLSLRPADRRALEQADIVLWVGPALEQPLEKVVATSGKVIITAQTLKGIQLITDDNVVDPHLWLDVANTRVIAAALLEALRQRDAANAVRYQANAERFSLQLDQLNNELKTALQPWQRQPWAVSHQAFRYFARQYGLQEPTALTDSNNAAPGVQRVLQLRERISRQGITCLITEPSENHQQLDSMLDNKLVSVVTADAMGTALNPAADAYIALLRQVGVALQQCLGGSQHG
ncbi:MAG TPA: zinc ABC transporter substrate-binding protein [Candidatus Acidoferrum sp.]|nr:zinc ABC transporter substrate-binding protein [Candidatus Acidoferrum sp.]